MQWSGVGTLGVSCANGDEISTFIFDPMPHPPDQKVPLSGDIDEALTFLTALDASNPFFKTAESLIVLFGLSMSSQDTTAFFEWLSRLCDLKPLKPSVFSFMLKALPYETIHALLSHPEPWAHGQGAALLLELLEGIQTTPLDELAVWRGAAASAFSSTEGLVKDLIGVCVGDFLSVKSIVSKAGGSFLDLMNCLFRWGKYLDIDWNEIPSLAAECIEACPASTGFEYVIQAALLREWLSSLRLSFFHLGMPWFNAMFSAILLKFRIVSREVHVQYVLVYAEDLFFRKELNEALRVLKSVKSQHARCLELLIMERLAIRHDDPLGICKRMKLHLSIDSSVRKSLASQLLKNKEFKSCMAALALNTNARVLQEFFFRCFIEISSDAVFDFVSETRGYIENQSSIDSCVIDLIRCICDNNFPVLLDLLPNLIDLDPMVTFRVVQYIASNAPTFRTFPDGCLFNLFLVLDRLEDEVSQSEFELLQSLRKHVLHHC